MQHSYQVTIQADRYPTTYEVTGPHWHTAVFRAIKEWERRFKGSRTKELRIKALKGIIQLNGDEQR